ncbi:hypothetical protein F8388_022063 [Cannabis sativa]|uniref:Aspartate aminotransferase n=1 Tax=Cannabis sativa TaxID=3483 RepID=A0A7J6G7M5_CANSA|nr:hypothetical protein F8388_022063 [Cannabis sativa]
MMMMMMMKLTKRCVSTSTRGRAAVGDWWDHVKPSPKDPIVGVTEAFLQDPTLKKINLGVGAYRDDQGKPVVLQCVRDAETKIAGSDFLESISAAATSKFIQGSLELVYGKDSNVITEGTFAGIQALSGTGACRLFAEFQKRFYPESRMYLSNPTWSNHQNIWRDAHVPQRTFNYYDPDTKGLNFAALMDDIKNAPEKSFFLLHPCAHNPTGVDPTEEQWREISYLFKVKNHFPFFDMAYQGFASGDLDNDAKAIRIFHEDGHLIGCAQSYAKNMGLYAHRVGCLRQCSLFQCKASNCSQKPTTANCQSNVQQSSYSWPITSLNNLRRFGYKITMDQRVKVDQLAREFHVYMTRDGRISMAGVTSGNVNYLANAIHQVTCCDQESMNSVYNIL